MRHGLRKDGGEGTELEMRARIPEKTVERHRVKAGKSTEKAAKNAWAREHLMKKWKMPDVHFTERCGDNGQIEKVLIGQKE